MKHEFHTKNNVTRPKLYTHTPELIYKYHIWIEISILSVHASIQKRGKVGKSRTYSSNWFCSVAAFPVGEAGREPAGRICRSLRWTCRGGVAVPGSLASCYLHEILSHCAQSARPRKLTNCQKMLSCRYTALALYGTENNQKKIKMAELFTVKYSHTKSVEIYWKHQSYTVHWLTVAPLTVYS